MKKIYTDTDRINWIIANNADIEAPDENRTWVIYTPKEPFGAGVGCHRNLRKAIDIAISKGCRCDPTKGPCSYCGTLSD